VPLSFQATDLRASVNIKSYLSQIPMDADCCVMVDTMIDHPVVKHTDHLSVPVHHHEVDIEGIDLLQEEIVLLLNTSIHMHLPSVVLVVAHHIVAHAVRHLEVEVMEGTVVDRGPRQEPPHRVVAIMADHLRLELGGTPDPRLQ